MSLTLAWPPARVPQSIAPGEIHVWAWPLDSLDEDPGVHTPLFDEEELSRFHRFHFDRDRSRFALAHGNMRRILGAYLDRSPDRVRFHANPFGKPELAGETSPMRFNLSHSRSTALLALSPGTEVGVDIEDLKAIEPEVAKSYFSASELSALNTLQGDAWLRGFYHCWTRKEALLKAEGVGLNLPLDAFDVSLLPGAPAELIATRPGAAFRHHWTLHDLAPGAGMAAALAAGNPHAKVACFRVE